MLRKQINSISLLNFLKGNVPFYAWQCISISTMDRQVDLIIHDESDMMNLISLLIYKLQTIDGFKGTSLSHIEGNKYKETIRVYDKVLFRYKIIKIRMKISCIAFEQKKSILELFLIAIMKTHKKLF
jgi:hypothetical protein